MAIASLYTVCVILIVMHKPAALDINRSLCLETIIKFMHDKQKCGCDYMHADGVLKDCAILIVMHKPAALNINRSLCLETIVKFMNNQQKCDFDYMYADGLLEDYNATCQTKCQISIHYSYDDNLEKVVSGFGYKIYEYKPCTWLHSLPALKMNIICPAWNKTKVPVGGFCKQNEQCHGSNNSGVCENGRCVCRDGYILFNLECHEGHIALNKSCSFSEQCSGSPYASCLGGICSCIEGYTVEESTRCVQIRIPVDEYCTQNEQCQRNENSRVCENNRCVCRAEYIQYNLKCYEGNLPLNEPCSFSEQCVGSPYASCLGGICSCIEGYTANESTYCVLIKVPLGGYCTHNEQCHGNENSGVCEQGRCVCRTGYIQYDLKCYKHFLALNQSCTSSDQCAGSPYASCFGGKCTCIKGYTAENSTKCFQSQEITVSRSLQHHQEGAKIGTTLGALFGGLFLGVVLTTVAVRIFYRRSKTYVNKREEPNVAFADNKRYSLAKIVDHSTFQNIQTKDKKREVSPYACSEETWIYDNVNSKPRNRQTQEAVYNHLHEQVKQDDDDYYDHASAASAHIGDMDDYSHVKHTTS